MVKPGAKPKIVKISSKDERDQTDSVILVDGTPDAPGWLGKYGKEEWARIFEALPSGVITTADLGALASLCDYWQIAQAAREEFLEGGSEMIVTTHNKARKANPLLPIIRQNSIEYMKACALFGLNPTERTRMKIPMPLTAEQIQDKEFFG